MKRLVTVLAPIAILAALVIGAAPSTKKVADVDSPSATQPTATSPEATGVAPIESAPLNDQAIVPAPEVQPQPADANANYAIDWYSINGGGTVNATSTNYKMGASIGQSVAGAATSTNYQMGIGFWYGANAGGCACDCHADPGGPCDNFTDILDVTQIVNAAFRNAAPINDPNANCPYLTTDVNCSGDPEVLDVVKMVNVAFRNGNPAVEFCNPCT